ncbi:MAG: ATP-binding protein [Prevotellaceae bacterium]|nr:ATP-binding protein [Prevotellaceae bacterium]
MVIRMIENEILQKLQPQRAVLIFGARRVGKTVLLKEILSKFDGKTMLLNGEDYESALLLEVKSIARYRDLFTGIGLLAIDEAQNITDIGKIIKLIVDEVPGIAVIATGSSAFDLINKTGEPLVGRSYSFQLFPFSQAELNRVENRLETERNLESRLIFGSYPEVYAMTNEVERIVYLKSLINSYLLKDILSIDGIKNSDKMLNLLRMIAFQVGSEVSYIELAQKLGISRNTVERYLDLLSKVFVIFRVGAFAKNLRKEISKNSKWYFYDNGIRNALISSFAHINLRNDTGALWENYLIAERVKKCNYNHNYANHFFWRTYDGQEIDLIESRGDDIWAYEFKWGERTPNAPNAFSKNYPKASYLVINRSNYLEFV